MRLFEEIGGNIQEKKEKTGLEEEKKTSTLRAFASRANILDETNKLVPEKITKISISVLFLADAGRFVYLCLVS